MKRIIVFLVLIIITFLLIVINVNINSNSKIIITDTNNEEIMYVNNNHYTNTTNIDDLNDIHIKYILAIEDQNFYKHSGFDLKRIFSSVFYNLTHKDTMGASTITQQYIKNTYLNNNKNIFRKIKEILLAIRIENTLTKDEILSEYLSSIYFGNNVYGIDNAAKYYYNKEIKELTNKEMISLIALWNSPSIYSNSLEKWNIKKNNIAKKLYKKGLVTAFEYTDILSPIKLNICKEFISSNKLFYIDQVMQEFNQLGINTGFNQEIIIKTSYDKRLEKLNIPTNSNYSLIAYNKDGYIICCIGNSNYYKSTFNIAINGKRDIGSTIKPILYYEAIKCGFKEQKFDSMPYTYLYNNDVMNVTNRTGLYYGNIGMREALAVSDNIYAIKTHISLGMNTLALHLKKYGINANPIPSLALGSIGMSLKQLCDIYTQFFNIGNYIKTRFISSIFTKGLNTKYTPLARKVNSSILCEQINTLLEAPFSTDIKHSTCGNISNNLLVKCRGKTGSTDYDSYIIGYSDDYLIGAWAGNIEGNEEISSTASSIPKALFTKTINLLTK